MHLVKEQEKRKKNFLQLTCNFISFIFSELGKINGFYVEITEFLRQKYLKG